GDGTLQAPVQPMDSDVTDVAGGDFDGDGLDDLVSASRTTFSVTVAKALGGGAFGDPVSVPVAAGLTDAVAVGDANGDGRLDILFTARPDPMELAEDVGVLFGAGDGTFDAGPLLASHVYVEGAVLHDVNGDGVSDAVMLADDELTTVLSEGGGTFSEP